MGQDKTLLESINNDYLSTFDRRQRSNISRLILNIDDHAFFEAIINGNEVPSTRESHERLLEARKSARKHVRAIARPLNDKDKPDILNDWLEFLEHSATVILVETQNGAQAFKMFETLNDRGLKTSQADLVKSYLFGQSGSRIQEAQSRWSSMKDNLEEIEDDDRAINFLRHAIIATRKFVRAEDVYEFTQSVRGEANSLAFLSDLERLSRLYVSTHRVTSAQWDGYPATATHALATFNRFDIKPMRPLVLSLATSLDGKQDFAECMAFLASLSVRLVVASSTRSGSIEQALASAALKVFTKDVRTLGQLKDNLRSVMVSDADFEGAFEIARVSRADLARYYLRTLESQKAGDHEPWYQPNDDPAVMTLEHVLPVNSTPEDWPNFDEDEKKRFVKRLGNLCILNKSANNNYGNLPFEFKAGAIRDAPYKLTNEIGIEPEWNMKAIERRQEALAALAVKAWPN